MSRLPKKFEIHSVAENFSCTTYSISNVRHFLRLALTPPQVGLISVQSGDHGDVLLACDGQLAAMFHCNGGRLRAFLDGVREPDGPIQGIIDHRWMTIYFLPENAFVPVDSAISAVEAFFQDAPLELVDVAQDTPACGEIYRKLKADGAFDD